MLRILTPSSRPKPFGDTDAMLVLETLGRNMASGRRTGRDEMMRETELSEGYVRMVLKRLGAMGLIDISSRGMILSPSGSEFLRTLGISLMDVGHTDSAIGVHQVALLLKGRADRIVKGVEQRDSALKSGGDGCTTIICKDGILILPPDWDVEANRPALASQIRAHGVEEGDVVLIGGSNTGRRKAAAAANSAALELIS